LIYNPLENKKLQSDINIVPYIDVMLVLLIIFMILSPLLIQGVDVNLPETDTTKMSIESEPMVISIDSNGQYFLNLGDDALSISLKEIKSKVQIIFRANPEIEIVLKSDSKVEFDYVAKALASIQSVGVEKVGIITTGYADQI